ncbi:MAG: gluconokinase [Cyanobacteriota bacterium]|nr:gluconokinase [Cyanobacteriota bacterium]
MTIILMGVAGSGKTTVGLELARILGGVFQDGDEFHPPANLSKMSRGEPLTDEDRQPWLEKLGDAIAKRSRHDIAKRSRHDIAALTEGEKPYILACSALKQEYRHFLSRKAKNVKFIYLKGSKDFIQQRLAARENHFMPPSLLESQFAALEEPQDALIVDIRATPEEIAAEIVRRLHL